MIYRKYHNRSFSVIIDNQRNQFINDFWHKINSTVRKENNDSKIM